MAEPGSENIKRQFREALDRKNHARIAATAHLDGQSKVHDAHGSADHKRQFRRKSG